MTGGLRAQEREGSRRLRMFRFFFLFFGSAIVLRLVALQVVDAQTYRAIADKQHTRYRELAPRRGSLFVRDAFDPTWYPVATTEPRATIEANPSNIIDPVTTARQIASIVHMDGLEEYDRLQAIADLRSAGREADAQALEERMVTFDAEGVPEPLPTLEDNAVAKLVARLSKKDDPWEPVTQGVSEAELRLIEALQLPGISYRMTQERAYPEPAFGGQVIGFLGKDVEGATRGFYGIEGYFDEFLSGIPGSLYAQADSTGSWVGVGEREITPALDGGDVYLTLDRTLQVVACEKLAQTVAHHQADSGALVILNPKTGAVLAMCGAPDFYPADYGSVTDFGVYANPAIFTPYEPGSIFKPFTLAAAIDAGAITPTSIFTDPGFVDVGWVRPIKNAANAVFGEVTMIDALKQSINTAMVWAMRQTGQETFLNYVEKFGFGTLTGIELNTEVSGTLAALKKSEEVYFATASFGQGITTTPLQIAAAYAALANEGKYMKPYVVAEKHYADGTIERTEPTFLRQVISPETAEKIAGMLVAVVEDGHGKRAGVPGYYIAGKTGTAQIAQNGVYSDTAFNGSFAGFGPVEDPQFVMVVKIENPKSGVIYAESTAAPLFGEIADFLLTYYAIPPTR